MRHKALIKKKRKENADKTIVLRKILKTNGIYVFMLLIYLYSITFSISIIIVIVMAILIFHIYS